MRLPGAAKKQKASCEGGFSFIIEMSFSTFLLGMCQVGWSPYYITAVGVISGIHPGNCHDLSEQGRRGQGPSVCGHTALFLKRAIAHF